MIVPLCCSVCEYRQYKHPADLPTTDGTFDIEVPKAGAAKPAASPEI